MCRSTTKYQSIVSIKQSIILVTNISVSIAFDCSTVFFLDQIILYLLQVCYKVAMCVSKISTLYSSYIFWLYLEANTKILWSLSFNPLCSNENEKLKVFYTFLLFATPLSIWIVGSCKGWFVWHRRI